MDPTNVRDLAIIVCGSVAIVLLFLILLWQFIIPSFIRVIVSTFIISLFRIDAKDNEEKPLPPRKPHTPEFDARAQADESDFEDALNRYRRQGGDSPHISETLSGTRPSDLPARRQSSSLEDRRPFLRRDDDDPFDDDDD